MKQTTTPQKLRGSWNGVIPVTRVIPNKKRDVHGNRKRNNAILRKYL